MLSLTKKLVSNRLFAPIFKMSAIQGAQISTTKARFHGDDPNLTVGSWPRTQAERERAAKKYNLIPEDYEPYEEGLCLGDYPKLKAVGAFNLDPYDDYDDPYDMRHYGEVFHRDADLYYWERIDPLDHEKMQFSAWEVVLGLIVLVSILPVTYYLFTEYKIEINHNYKKRKYHPKDQKYYEFPSSTASAH